MRKKKKQTNKHKTKQTTTNRSADGSVHLYFEIYSKLLCPAYGDGEAA